MAGETPFTLHRDHRRSGIRMSSVDVRSLIHSARHNTTMRRAFTFPPLASCIGFEVEDTQRDVRDMRNDLGITSAGQWSDCPRHVGGDMTGTAKRKHAMRLGLYALILLTMGCVTRYVPEIVLPYSPQTIDAKTEWHPLEMTEAALAGEETFGVLAPRVRMVAPGELNREVAAAVFDDFSRSHVFRSLGVDTPQPDILVTGHIDKFYEHYRPHLWALLPGGSIVGWLLRLNTYTSSGQADLTVILLKPTGEVIGRYAGQSSFDASFRPNAKNRPGMRLNRALTQAVQQVRGQMLDDPHLPKVRWHLDP
jgi:hypothetical protein